MSSDPGGETRCHEGFFAPRGPLPTRPRSPRGRYSPSPDPVVPPGATCSAAAYPAHEGGRVPVADIGRAAVADIDHATVADIGRTAGAGVGHAAVADIRRAAVVGIGRTGGAGSRPVVGRAVPSSLRGWR